MSDFKIRQRVKCAIVGGRQDGWEFDMVRKNPVSVGSTMRSDWIGGKFKAKKIVDGVVRFYPVKPK